VRNDRIEKDIDLNKFPHDFNCAMIEPRIIAQLKDAGIPIDGVLAYRGVKRGRLTAYDSKTRPGIRHFIWVYRGHSISDKEGIRNNG